MEKAFRIDGIDCANCAAKIEKAVRKIDGVQNASVSFFAQKLILEADDARWDAIVEEVCRTVQRVDADCTVRR